MSCCFSPLASHALRCNSSPTKVLLLGPNAAAQDCNWPFVWKGWRWSARWNKIQILDWSSGVLGKWWGLIEQRRTKVPVTDCFQCSRRKPALSLRSPWVEFAWQSAHVYDTNYNLPSVGYLQLLRFCVAPWCDCARWFYYKVQPRVGAEFVHKLYFIF